MLEVMIKKLNKEEVTVVTSLDVAETFEKKTFGRFERY